VADFQIVTPIVVRLEPHRAEKTGRKRVRKRTARAERRVNGNCNDRDRSNHRRPSASKLRLHEARNAGTDAGAEPDVEPAERAVAAPPKAISHDKAQSAFRPQNMAHSAAADARVGIAVSPTETSDNRSK